MRKRLPNTSRATRPPHGRAAAARRRLLLCALALGWSLNCEAPAAPAAGTPLRPQQQTARARQSETLADEGVASLERGDEASARATFQRALAIDSHNVRAHTYLGVLADRDGDLKVAERHFAAAAIAAPLLPPVRNNYGAILLRTGRVAEAAAQFEASLKLDGKQPSALVNLAQIRFASGTPENLRAAQGLFERARAIAPDAEIARALVVISLRLGDARAAQDYYRHYTIQLSAARTPELRPTPAARAELGAALLASGLAAEAAEGLAPAVDEDASNVTSIVLLARAHLARGDVAAAGRTLESAVARGIEAAPVYAALAEVYEKAGRVENAIPAMRLAIARDPRSEAYRFRYGMLLTDTKAPAAAVIRLEEALKEFSSSSRLWLALGIAQLASGKNDEATKAFERAAALDPQFAAALAYLGTAYTERGQYAEAVAFYERAIAVDPKLAVPYYLAADALLKQPNVDTARAERHLTRAIELDPSFAPARLALGRLYARAERWAEAAAQLERAVAIDSKLAEAHYQLGRVYMRLKRTGEAQSALATFKQLNEAQKEQTQNERREMARRLVNVLF